MVGFTEQEAAVSRRTANAGLFTALAACIAASPAQAALLGLSPQKDPIQQYKDDTVRLKAHLSSGSNMKG